MSVYCICFFLQENSYDTVSIVSRYFFCKINQSLGTNCHNIKYRLLNAIDIKEFIDCFILKTPNRAAFDIECRAKKVNILAKMTCFNENVSVAS